MPSMTRKSQASRQERREQIERRLLDATDQLMSDGASFTELSVDRLATAAGISRATFYIYFEDKGHLLRQLARQVFVDLTGGAALWWNAALHRDPDDVRAGINGVIAGFRRHQQVLSAINEMASYDRRVGETYRGLLDGVAQRVTGVIHQGQAAGVIRRELPAESTASALTWMTERSCQQNLPGRPAEYDAELATALTEIIWATLYLDASSAR